MKKVWTLGLMLLVIVILSACGDKPQAGSPDQDPPKVVIDESSQGGVSANPEQVDPDRTQTGGQDQPQVIESVMKLYFTDENLMELSQSERKVTYSDEQGKYTEAFKQLQNAPDNMISLWDKVKLNTTTFQNGLLTLDITMPDEARLGAGGESLAVESLQKTMFQFAEVSQLEITVDGEQIDSLMGHVELEHPISK